MLVNIKHSTVIEKKYEEITQLVVLYSIIVFAGLNIKSETSGNILSMDVVNSYHPKRKCTDITEERISLVLYLRSNISFLTPF